MSKLLAGTLLVGLNGALVAGGGWLIHAGIQKQELAAAELSDNLTALAKEAHTRACVPNLFPGLADVSGASASVSSGDVSENFLNTADKKKNTAGCLVVNWDKKSKKGANNNVDKWSGNLRFLWTVRGESKGFLMLLVGTTSNSTEKKIKWEGTAYVLEKENDAWSAKKKQSAGDNKDFSKSTTEDGQFPQPGDGLGDIKDKKFWGLFTSKDDLDKVDSGTDLTENGSYRARWDWTGDDADTAKALDGWTKDLDKWWTAIFTKTNWDMTKVVKDLKGFWTNRLEIAVPEVQSSSSAS